MGVGQGQGVGRTEGIWTGGVARASAQWSALRGTSEEQRELRVAWAQGEDAAQVNPGGPESQAETWAYFAGSGSRGRWGREKAWRGRPSLAPRLGGLERLMCGDRLSSCGAVPPSPAGHWRQFC